MNINKKVNKKRMKSNGLFLKDIPEKEKTEEICKLYHLPKRSGRFIKSFWSGFRKKYYTFKGNRAK